MSQTITSPEPAATVSGMVKIEGTVESSAPVFRVELFVGDARKDASFPNPPSPAASFSLVWDASNRPPGGATIRVQACGGQPAQGSLVRGAAAVDVKVVASTAGPRAGGTLQPAGDEDDVSRGPLWVGLVVGVAGLAGLVVASRPVRSRARRRPDPAREPLDPGDRAPEAEAPHSR